MSAPPLDPRVLAIVDTDPLGLASDLIETTDQVAELQDQLAGAWVPVTIPAELVRAGDVIIGRDQRVLVCTLDAWSIIPSAPKVTLEVADPASTSMPDTWTIPRDYPVRVLVPFAEAGALEELRRQLGAEPINRNNNPGSGS